MRYRKREIVRKNNTLMYSASSHRCTLNGWLEEAASPADIYWVEGMQTAEAYWAWNDSDSGP